MARNIKTLDAKTLDKSRPETMNVSIQAYTHNGPAQGAVSESYHSSIEFPLNTRYQKTPIVYTVPSHLTTALTRTIYGNMFHPSMERSTDPIIGWPYTQIVIRLTANSIINGKTYTRKFSSHIKSSICDLVSGRLPKIRIKGGPNTRQLDTYSSEEEIEWLVREAYSPKKYQGKLVKEPETDEDEDIAKPVLISIMGETLTTCYNETKKKDLATAELMNRSVKTDHWYDDAPDYNIIMPTVSEPLRAAGVRKIYKQFATKMIGPRDLTTGRNDLYIIEDLTDQIVSFVKETFNVSRSNGSGNDYPIFIISISENVDIHELGNNVMSTLYHNKSHEWAKYAKVILGVETSKTVYDDIIDKKEDEKE